MKKLQRSDNRIIGGVCSGLAEYFDMAIDPTIIRIIMALLIFCTGIGLLVYIIMWILMPSKY